MSAGWQPIETAPSDGTAIWLLLNGHPYIGYCEPADWLHKEDNWLAKATFVRRGSPADDRATPTSDNVYCCYAHGVHPTHWQPLPEPPAAPPTDITALRDEGGC